MKVNTEQNNRARGSYFGLLCSKAVIFSIKYTLIISEALPVRKKLNLKQTYCKSAI